MLPHLGQFTRGHTKAHLSNAAAFHFPVHRLCLCHLSQPQLHVLQQEHTIARDPPQKRSYLISAEEENKETNLLFFFFFFSLASTGDPKGPRILDTTPKSSFISKCAPVLLSRALTIRCLEAPSNSCALFRNISRFCSQFHHAHQKSSPKGLRPTSASVLTMGVQNPTLAHFLPLSPSLPYQRFSQARKCGDVLYKALLLQLHYSLEN